MRTRAAIMMACTGLLLLATGCGGPNYVTNRRHLPQESCPDVESLPGCEARIDGLSAALADALAPAQAAVQEQSVQQSAPAMDEPVAGAPARESDEESSAPSEDKDHKGGPDCASARDLRDRICDLSDAICALAARDGAPPEIMDRCTAARTSCERARSEVSNVCPR
jgi:hypothetical protein